MKKYTVLQIADLLDTNPETIRRWIRDDKLEAEQASRKSGNLVTEAALVRFLNETPKYAARASQKGLDLSRPPEVVVIDPMKKATRVSVAKLGLGSRRGAIQKAMLQQLKITDAPALTVPPIGTTVDMRRKELTAQILTKQREIEVLKRQVRALQPAPRTSGLKKK